MNKTHLFIVLSTIFGFSIAANESNNVTTKQQALTSSAPTVATQNTLAASATTSGKNIKKTANNKGANVVSQINCAADSPCEVIKNSSIDVLTAINRDLDAQQTMAIITEKITPRFNFEVMTKYAMGQNWKLANAKQQKELVENFQNLLIFTYSSALSKFRGSQITIMKETINDRKAAVMIQITLPNSGKNGQPIGVEYDMVKVNPQSTWQAYDIKIENASLVTTYRNQFNDIIARNNVSGLIKELKARVASLEKNGRM